MSSQHSIRELRAILRAIRSEIELFERAAPTHRRDNEHRKRLKKAKIQESVLVEKLKEWGQQV